MDRTLSAVRWPVETGQLLSLATGSFRHRCLSENELTYASSPVANCCLPLSVVFQ
jgi:hypothetical protein